MSSAIKRSNIEIHQVSDQFVIYEAGTDVIHYLNPTAMLVLEFCDGKRDLSQISELIREAYGLSDAPLEEIGNCLVQLKELQLVG